MRSNAHGVCSVSRVLMLRLVLLFLLVVVLTGCGATSGHVDPTSEVAPEARLNALLQDIEIGDYRAACESFSLRSKVGMAIASALDGHQTGSPCSDVFVVGRALSYLGLKGTAERLEDEADRRGLRTTVDLPAGTVHRLYRGIARRGLVPVAGNLMIEDERALYEGRTIAVKESGRWGLEAVSANVTTAELAREALSSCKRPAAARFLGSRLCLLMRSVFAGRMLNDREHREFIALFPRTFQLPSREHRAFEQAYRTR